MNRISRFDSRLATLLPATFDLLMSASLIVHPNVSRITLHGSRGLAGGYRPDSDIDLSLLVDTKSSLNRTDLGTLLQDVLDTTQSGWHGPVELDLAAIFDIHNCNLKCFDQMAYDEQFCPVGGVDCFGLYKVQKGFTGFVENAGIEVKRMYPCLQIWQRA